MYSPLSKIDTPSISRFVTQRKSDNLSNTTIRTDLQIIRMFFNSLIEEDVISKSPMNKRLIPKPEKKEVLTLTENELKSVFTVTIETDPMFYKYLGILFLTGIRPGDGTKLTIGNIKPENELINFDISKTKSVLKFPLYATLLNFLSKEFPDFNKQTPADRLFPEYKSHTVGRKFNRLKKELNLNINYNLKTFRKTFATYLANNGFEDSMVSYLLGHALSGTANKFYIKKNFDLLKKKLDSLDFNFR
jgi:integrase